MDCFKFLLSNIGFSRGYSESLLGMSSSDLMFNFEVITIFGSFTLSRFESDIDFLRLFEDSFWRLFANKLFTRLWNNKSLLFVMILIPSEKPLSSVFALKLLVS